MTEIAFDNAELHAVLDDICSKLEIHDEAGRSRMHGRILLLAKGGVRDFDVLRNLARRPPINRFSMVDPN